jgi:hypothetical protein
VPRREEWLEQVKLSHLLDRWLNPTCSFWTAIDPVAGSMTSGAMRKKRGVKPGVPDVLVWYRGRSITLELKSRYGRCNRSQRLVHAALLRAGAEVWQCKSASSSMWALRRSGLKFRTFVNEDGTIERWRQPKLAPWEVPLSGRAAAECAGRGGEQRWRGVSAPVAIRRGRAPPEPNHIGRKTDKTHRGDVARPRQPDRPPQRLRR